MLASVWLYDWDGPGLGGALSPRRSLLWQRLEFVEGPAAISGFRIFTAIALRISARCMALLAMPSPRSGSLTRSNRTGRINLPIRSAGQPDGTTIARPGRNPIVGIVRAARPSWCSIVIAHSAS